MTVVTNNNSNRKKDFFFSSSFLHSFYEYHLRARTASSLQLNVLFLPKKSKKKFDICFANISYAIFLPFFICFCFVGMSSEPKNASLSALCSNAKFHRTVFGQVHRPEMYHSILNWQYIRVFLELYACMAECIEQQNYK